MKLSAGALLLIACAALWAAPVAASAAPAEPPKPALGLAVQPGGLLLQDVVPGEAYDLKERTGIALTVFNRDSRDRTYQLSTHRPSETGSRRLPAGYSDLPDPAWLTFDRPEVLVPAQGSAEARMYLTIPADSRYWNQHWSVSVGVVGKATPGEMINLAAYPRFEIETASAPRRALKLRPVGEIGIVPSRLTLGPLPPGGRRNAQFLLCNNDTRRHSYRLSVLSEGVVSADSHLVSSGNYRWLPQPDWVRVRPDRVRLAKRETRIVALRLKLPPTAVVPPEGWEAIALVQREDGCTAFLRLLVPPQADPKIGGQS